SIDFVSRAARTGLPVLMKDVVIDSRQIDAAARCGASALLLIETLARGGHSHRRIDRLIDEAHDRKVEVVLEVHTLEEWDPAFLEELESYYRHYGGRPTPLYLARRLTDHIGGAQIYLKREDLCHGGAHKFNNVMGQALLARRMGKKRVIAETGAGQHGVATAMVGAVLGLPVEVYMGAADMQRQSLNVFRMRLLGATVHRVEQGSRTLKDAINEALRDWVTNVENTYYLLGSVVG